MGHCRHRPAKSIVKFSELGAPEQKHNFLAHLGAILFCSYPLVDTHIITERRAIFQIFTKKEDGYAARAHTKAQQQVQPGTPTLNKQLMSRHDSDISRPPPGAPGPLFSRSHLSHSRPMVHARTSCDCMAHVLPAINLRYGVCTQRRCHIFVVNGKTIVGASCVWGAEGGRGF